MFGNMKFGNRLSSLIAAAMVAARGFAFPGLVTALVYRSPTPTRHRPKKTSYGQGLMNQFDRQRRDAARVRLDSALRSFTYVGRNDDGTRRIWTAGVDAQAQRKELQHQRTLRATKFVGRSA